MSDEELIARLLSNIFGTGTTMLAADRIKALTEQLNAARQDAKEAEAYAEELEAKLAAAVEALICGRYFHAGEATRAQFIKAYRTAMSEIKGESHD